MMMASRVSNAISYYFNDYLAENGDPITSTLAGMQSPVMFCLIGLYLIVSIKFIIPKFMAKKKPMNTKHYNIIANGLAFGTSTCGLAVFLIGTPAISNSLNCHSYQRFSTDTMDIAIKLTSWCAIIAKLYDFIGPVLSVLAKRNSDVTNLQLAQIQTALMFAWLGSKVNPGGLIILIALLDHLYSALVYGYLIMVGVSEEMKPTRESRTMFKYFLHKFRMFTVIAVMPLAIYTTFQSDCPNFELRLLSSTYLIVYAILFPIDIANREMKKLK